MAGIPETEDSELAAGDRAPSEIFMAGELSRPTGWEDGGCRTGLEDVGTLRPVGWLNGRPPNSVPEESWKKINSTKGSRKKSCLFNSRAIKREGGEGLVECLGFRLLCLPAAKGPT